MRNILFKAKRTDTREWVEGWYCEYPFSRWPLKACIIPSKNAEEGELKHIEVEPETVCQYTGLSDKNGNKIFEGDVLLFFNGDAFAPWVAEVKWMHCEYYLEGISRIAGVFLSDFAENEMEIIGNIHNKEDDHG